MDKMRRDFNDRDELADYLREQFPNLTAQEHLGFARGGREAALEQLHSADLQSYARTRNRLDGDVTRLSPFIRHGVLTLAEVRDYAVEQNAPEKFVNELGWRDFFQRNYDEMGNGIWDDREAYKTGFSADDYANELPDDIRNGETGTIMDVFARELIETGYLHNHVRMWLAAYIIHWRRVKWQAGARWFLEHLLDGDPASNNLSWQWVASTFSHKPYYYNADNLRKFAPHLRGENMKPFEGSYDQIAARLFPHANFRNDNNRNRRGKKRR